MTKKKKWRSSEWERSTQKMFTGDLFTKRTEAFMKEAKQYYDAHHEKLIEACSSNKDILLLDIHSFNA